MSYLRTFFDDLVTTKGRPDEAALVGAQTFITVPKDELLERLHREHIELSDDFRRRLDVILRGSNKVAMLDILLAASTSRFEGDDTRGLDVFRALEDLDFDFGMTNKLVEFVNSNYSPDSAEVSALRQRLAKVGLDYRGVLLHILRVLTAQIAAFDELQRDQAVWGPIVHACGIGYEQLMGTIPDPFEFQQSHYAAITNRLSALHIASRYLVKKQRLHYRAAQKAAIVTTTFSPIGGSSRTVAIEHVPEMDPHRTTTIESIGAFRNDTTAEKCAEEGVPYDVEMVRAPLFALTNPVAAASTTCNYDDMLKAATTTISEIKPHKSLVNEYPVTDEGRHKEDALSGLPAIPAPSALSWQPRAHLTNSEIIYADYTAHTELILSTYFPDVCGMHEAGDVPTSLAVTLGPTMTFVYELVPAMIPLAQVVQVCGRMTEAQALFRHVAGELLRAFRDIETQCTFDIPPNGITIDNVYVSDQGTRLTLRGIPWGAPCAQFHERDTQKALKRRSRRLLSCFGNILLQLLPGAPHPCASLPDLADTLTRQMTHDEQSRVFTRAHIEAGFSVVENEVFEILLPLTRTMPKKSSSKSSAAGSQRSPSPSKAPSYSSRDLDAILQGFSWKLEPVFGKVGAGEIKVLSTIGEVVPAGQLSFPLAKSSASTASGGTGGRTSLTRQSAPRSRSSSPSGNARNDWRHVPMPAIRLRLLAVKAGEFSAWLKRIRINDSAVLVEEDEDVDDVSTVAGSVTFNTPKPTRTNTTFEILMGVRVHTGDISSTLKILLDNCLPPLRTHPAFTALATIAETISVGVGSSPADVRGTSVYGASWHTNPHFIGVVRNLAHLLGLPSSVLVARDASREAMLAGDFDALRLLLELFYPQGSQVFGHLTLGEEFDTLSSHVDQIWELVATPEEKETSSSKLDEAESASSVAELRKQMRSGDPDHWFAAVQEDFAMYAFPLLHR